MDKHGKNEIEVKAPEPSPTVTVSLEVLNALISGQVKVGIAEAAAKSVVEANDFEKAMKTIRGQDKPAEPCRYEDCVSPLTGASFRAKIMPSRSSPLGRVIDLEDYVWPAGIDVPQSRGGLMPDEFVTAIEAPEAPSSVAVKAKFDHWKYWEFQLVDRREYASGKLFTRYILKAEADRRREMDAQAAAGTPVGG